MLLTAPAVQDDELRSKGFTVVPGVLSEWEIDQLEELLDAFSALRGVHVTLPSRPTMIPARVRQGRPLRQTLRLHAARR